MIRPGPQPSIKRAAGRSKAILGFAAAALVYCLLWSAWPRSRKSLARSTLSGQTQRSGVSSDLYLEGSHNQAAANSLGGAHLLLASHNRLFWYSTPGRVSVLHEGEGVYYGVFSGHRESGSRSNGSIWVVSRPHNWRPTSSVEHLLHLDLDTGAELGRVAVPTRFAHDAVRWRDKVYICSTGTDEILEFAYPSLAFSRVVRKFSQSAHVNTLAPDGKGGLWALLHKHGESELVRMTLSTGKVVQRMKGFGRKAHGLVHWGNQLLALDSASSALMLVQPTSKSIERLWQAPEEGKFLKGLSVVDDVAYFGIAASAPRSARHDPALDCELAAFDLLQRTLLWRSQVPSHGLLNTVNAPQLGEGSPYLAMRSPGAEHRARSLLWWPVHLEDTREYCAHYQDNATGCHDDPRCQVKGTSPVTCKPCSLQSGCMGRRRKQLPFAEEGEALPRRQRRKGSQRGPDMLWGMGRSNADIAQSLSAKGSFTKYATIMGGRWASGLPYMDITKKDAIQTGVRLDLAQVDVADLNAAIEAQGSALWDEHFLSAENAVVTGREENLRRYKPGTQSVYLIFSDQTGDAIYHMPLYEVFRPSITPILEKLLGAEDVDRVMRMQLAQMPAGTSIVLHLDTGGYAKAGHRIHVPLTVPPGSGTLFLACPGARRAETVRPEECINLPLREGQAFEFNNALAHAVRNEGPGDRVHLVIDVAERHYDRATRLRKGQVCQYIGGRVNCEPDAAIKKSKPRDQARQHGRAW